MCVITKLGNAGMIWILLTVILLIIPKTRRTGVILMLALFIFVPALNSSTVGIMVPVGVLFTIGVSRLLYKKHLLD